MYDGLPSQETKVQGALLVVGVNRLGMAAVFSGDDLAELRDLAQPLIYYAVYRNDPSMATTTQEEFLVEYHNDPYWERKHGSATPVSH